MQEVTEEEAEKASGGHLAAQSNTPPATAKVLLLETIWQI
jgi:hypothetical protein